MALSDRIVVMHAGKIMQIGAPEEIYRRPQSREVAAFFGTPNLLAAAAVESRPEGGGLYRVVVRGEGWELACRAAHAFAPGTPLLAMIRPEDVRLSEPGDVEHGRQGVWRGKVSDTIFRGPRRSIVVDVGGDLFNVEAPSLQNVRVGENVTVTAVDGQAWAFKGDA